MRVGLTAGWRPSVGQAGEARGLRRGWRVLAIGLAACATAGLPAPASAAATALITEIEPICGAQGTARNILRMMTSQGLTGHVEDHVTHETLLHFEQAEAGEKRAGVGKQYPVVDVKVDNPATGESHTVDFSHCNETTSTTVTTTSTTVAAGGTSGTTVTTTAPAVAAPTAAPASGQAPLAAASRTLSTTPRAALAATGSSRIDYWMRLAIASFTLGLACMFVTQRRRFRRIDAWLSYVFNSF